MKKIFVFTLLFLCLAINPVFANANKAALNASLIEAVYKNDVALVKELLSRGADVGAKDSEGATPLTIAALGEYLDIMEVVLEKGADVEAPGSNYTSRGGAALQYAVGLHNEKAVRLLFAYGANPNPRLPYGETPFMTAIKDGYVKIAGILLENGADIDAQNDQGETALMLAVQKNNIDAMRFLLRKDAEANVSNKYGETALTMATDSANVEAVQLLLHFNADVEPKTEFFWSALMSAALGGNIDGRDPANQEKYIEILKTLIKNGATIDYADNLGSTALMIATAYGNIEAMEILLEHGANPRHTKYDGTTVFDVTHNNPKAIAVLEKYLEQARLNDAFLSAVDSRDFELMEELLHKGADVNSKNDFGNPALISCVSQNSMLILKFLLDNGAYIESKSLQDGKTALVWAATLGNREQLMQALIEAGANVNTKNDVGNTPLMICAQSGSTENGNIVTMKLLLENGADTEIKNNRGYTALRLASPTGMSLTSDRIDAMKILLENGADPNTRDTSGMSVLEFAGEGNMTQAMDLLKQYGAK